MKVTYSFELKPLNVDEVSYISPRITDAITEFVNRYGDLVCRSGASTVTIEDFDDNYSLLSFKIQLGVERMCKNGMAPANREVERMWRNESDALMKSVGIRFEMKGGEEE